jgi:integrase
LVEARERASQARKLKSGGVDPIGLKRDQAAERRAAERALEIPTFDESVEAFLKTQSAAWKNAKHSQQWTNTLKAYASPHFGSWPVSEVGFQAVMAALRPIWTTKPETASRVRGRIEAVLDWATVMEFRSGDNPARWKGNLDKALPSRNKLTKVKHHAALPYQEISAFLELLSARGEVAARALHFAILTAARTSEVLGLHWSELDLGRDIWVVPAERMKAGREHRVPLSEAAKATLPKRSESADADLVFPSPGSAVPLSINSMSAVLKRMRRDDITVHGFRSTFRDWAAEETNWSSEVVEAALAHTIGSKVEAAYRRGDLFEKRRKLMIEWSIYASAARRDNDEGAE